MAGGVYFGPSSSQSYEDRGMHVPFLGSKRVISILSLGDLVLGRNRWINVNILGFRF